MDLNGTHRELVDEMISSLWRRHTHGQHIADDSGSTYVAVMFALCGGDNIMDDGMLSRTTTILGGEECKVSGQERGRVTRRSCEFFAILKPTW